MIWPFQVRKSVDYWDRKALSVPVGRVQDLPEKVDSRLAILVLRISIDLMLAIRLQPDIEKRLDRLAKKTGRTKTFYAREAILQHLEDLEDYYLAASAAKNPGRTFTSGEAKRELGL